MSTKRARVVTVAAAGTLSLATVISVAGVTLSTAATAAGTSDAFLTSVNSKTATVQAADLAGSSNGGQAISFSQVRALQAEHEQKVAAEKAAAAKAAKAKAEAAKAKAEAARAAKAKAEAKAEAAKAARARAAANAAVKTQAVSAPSGTPQQIARQMVGSSSQFSCLNSLWEHESGWSVTAENASSGAYGIPQALPGSQMATAGGDWRTNAATQIKWGLTYIDSRYGSPCGAWAHEQASNWY
jgi:hypothetical protein